MLVLYSARVHSNIIYNNIIIIIIIIYTSIEARLRRRFGESALIPVFYQKHL